MVGLGDDFLAVCLYGLLLGLFVHFFLEVVVLFFLGSVLRLPQPTLEISDLFLSIFQFLASVGIVLILIGTVGEVSPGWVAIPLRLVVLSLQSPRLLVVVAVRSLYPELLDRLFLHVLIASRDIPPLLFRTLVFACLLLACQFFRPPPVL